MRTPLFMTADYLFGRLTSSITPPPVADEGRR